MSISQIRTVAIPVTDQERSLAFYTDVLGFQKTLDAPFGPGQRWIEVSPPGGGATIATLSIRLSVMSDVTSARRRTGGSRRGRGR